MEKLACAVFHVFSCVQECSEVRFSWLFLRLLLGLRCFILYWYVVSEAEQRMHQSYRNKEVSIVSQKDVIAVNQPTLPKSSNSFQY